MQNKNNASTYRPGNRALDHDIPAGQAGAKSPPLQSISPEKDQYLIIPAKRYFDRDCAEQEWQKVWARPWICAGLTSDIPEQDIANLIHMQQGVMSRGMSEGMRLGELKQRIQQVHAKIDRCIARQ